jgi:hypothetical protein
MVLNGAAEQKKKKKHEKTIDANDQLEYKPLSLPHSKANNFATQVVVTKRWFC